MLISLLIAESSWSDILLWLKAVFALIRITGRKLSYYNAKRYSRYVTLKYIPLGPMVYVVYIIIVQYVRSKNFNIESTSICRFYAWCALINIYISLTWNGGNNWLLCQNEECDFLQFDFPLLVRAKSPNVKLLKKKKWFPMKMIFFPYFRSCLL